MKLSAQTKYGLKVMCFLAKTDFKDFQSVSTISTNLNISEKYLEKLLSFLKKANLIVSSKGADGGYKLINSPNVLTCGKIVRALENLEYVPSTELDPCENLFKTLFNNINSTLDKITLQDLIDNKGEKNGIGK